MFLDYYVNRNSQENGDHEVHNSSCEHRPSLFNRIFLGRFDNCRDAVTTAKRLGYKTADGCYWCCNPCHKQ